MSDQRTLPLDFSVVPVMNGNVFTSTDGAERTATKASIVISSEDGSEYAVALEFRFGGWWTPAGARWAVMHA